MKRFLFVLIILAIGVISGCTKKEHNSTTYTGVVVEQNSLIPIAGLQVSITDGSNKYSETVTNNAGQFSMDMARNGNLGHLYIFIDGNGVYPSKNIDLIHTEESKYDYGMIYLYSQTDASLYPKIENVDWDYPNGTNTMQFKDIVINSDYSLTDAHVEISKNDGFAPSEKYQLEKQGNGTYSVSVNGLIVGERYYFRVVASNIVGTGRSEVYSREYGLPIPMIMELKNATINTATIKMCVTEEPLSTIRAGLCWSTSHNPTVNNNTQPGGISGTSEVTINGLDFRTTTYYVRAYAENSNGIPSYSEELPLPANNPYSLPTFTNGGYTYTYIYLGRGSWYTAYNECNSFVYVFDDWFLPSINVFPSLFNTYYAEHGESLPLPVWSMRRNDYDEEGESETFMVTTNGNILAPKNQQANYYAVRKF